METTKKEHAKKLNHIRLDFAQMQAFYSKYNKHKAKRDNIGWLKAYLVYVWIFAWQLHTKVGYGRVRKQDVFDEIERDLLEPKPNLVVNALIRAGMVVWGRSEYNGKVNYCLQCTFLNGKIGFNNTDIDENSVTVVESALPVHPKPSTTNNVAYEEPKLSVGVHSYGGYYYYTDSAGNVVKDDYGNTAIIPEPDAYNRPSIEHVYDFEVCRWCLPDELTVREPEF